MAEARDDLPLRRYALFHSRDVDEARESVARIFCPHLLAPVGRGRALDACHHSATLQRDVSLNYVQYGPSVDIQPGYLKDFFLLQMPLRGSAEVRCGMRTVRAGPRMASLPSPTEALSMRWSDDSPHLIVKLSRTALQRQLEQLAQQAVGRPLVFEPAVALDRPALAPMLQFVRYLRDALDADDALPGSLLARQAEGYLMSSLLLCVDHNHRNLLAPAGRRELLPRSVRRACDYVESRLDQPFSLGDLCAEVGASARTLQAAFRRHTGQTPMAFVRDARLDRIRQELRAAAREGSPVSVAAIAARYGFLNAGRLAAEYRARFGEAPSETLRSRLH